MHIPFTTTVGSVVKTLTRTCTHKFVRFFASITTCAQTTVGNLRRDIILVIVANQHTIYRRAITTEIRLFRTVLSAAVWRYTFAAGGRCFFNFFLVVTVRHI